MGVQNLNSNVHNTKFLLIGLFGTTPLIPLDAVCDAFLDISYNTAVRKAKAFALPFPALRVGQSQKSKWVVNIDDLANFVDQESNKARRSWQEVQA